MFKKQLLLVFLATLASQSAWAAQFARPASTTDSAGWNAVGALTHHEAVNEVAASDTDYIDSTGGNNSTIIMSLSGVTDPGGANLDDHIIRYRCQAQGSGGPERCNIALFQGNTEIGNNGNNSGSRGSFTLITWVIPDASTITNYNDLNVRVTSASLGGGESVQVSWIELEVPDAAASNPPNVTTPTAVNITHTAANLGGTIENDGGDAVTDHGTVFNYTGPTVTENPSNEGSTAGPFPDTFSTTRSPLNSGVRVYYRAYATNGQGTAYSPQGSFYTEPATQASGVNFTAVGSDAFTVNWTAGSGNGRLVVMRAGSAPAAPTDGVVYTASSTFGSGSLIGADSYVVATTGTSVSVTGLTSNTTYHVAVYEYAGTVADAGDDLGINYKPTPAIGNQLTTLVLSAPTLSSPTATGISDVSATLGATIDSDGGASVTAHGTVWNTGGTPTTADNANDLGAAGPGYPDTFSSLRDTPAMPSGTQIFYRGYATNSEGTDYSPQGSFYTEPATQASGVNFTGVGSDAFTVNWTAGSGNGRLVVMRAGSAPAAPTDGVVYSASSTFGSGSLIGADSYVVATTGASVSVTNLSPDTTYHVAVYEYAGTGADAGVNQGINYKPTPAAGSQLTDTAAETQASNLTFANKAGRSVRLTWTRGSRDGVIVVMRETATTPTLVGPSEGVDYTGNPEFSAPPETTGTGNYVVYKGPGTSVLVTGLTYTTSYSVAVYEYSGTDATSSYLAGPVEAADSTTNYDVHNYDYRANCDDCHNHSSFGARGPELKAVCSGCHNPTGLASARLEFDFEDTWNTTGATTTGHPTPTKNPNIDVVDCGMCHEVHNHTPSSTNTTYSTHSETLAEQNNLAFLRANVNKYVPNASPPAYLHTDTPGVSTPDRAVEGGNDTTARGYCQVCHTLTDYHRSSNTAGADQCHDGASNTSCGPEEVTCGLCHDHNNNFEGAGGSCTGCHASPQPTTDPIRPIITTQFDRFSKHIPGGSAAVTQADCEVCHDQTGHPGDQIVGLLDADDAGGPYEQTTAGASTLATGEGAAFEPACLSCHDSNGASRLPATGDQTPLSPFTGSGAPQVIDETVWNNASHSVMTCVGDGSNGCHGSGHGSENSKLLHPADTAVTLDHATILCTGCHDADGPSTFNIDAQFNTGTNYRTTAEDGANVNQRHDITNTPTDFAEGDQTYSGGMVTCKDCHAPHANNSANSVFELDALQLPTPQLVPLPLYSTSGRYTEDGHDFYYDSGGATPTDEDPTNPLGGSSVPEPDYIQFCLACHDGTPPSASVTMSTSLTNMAAAWNNDQHGNGQGGTGSQISKGNLKPPWNTQAAYEAGNDPSNTYAALNCTTCHGAHGSGNIFNLRESITVAGVQMSTGCPDGGTWCSGSEFAGIVGTSYTLPVEGGTQNDHKWGAWCTFCHNMSGHRGVTEATGCTSAHKHGANSF